MRLLSRFLLSGAVALLGVSDAFADDFQGAYDPTLWISPGIAGGTANVDLAASSVTDLVLTYDVNLGGGGVSYRTAEFTAIADFDGEVSFDWDYQYHHRWFQAEADLMFFAYDASGVRQDIVAFSGPVSGAGSANGMVASLPVANGQVFGVEVGGSNFDSNAQLVGTVTLTNFVTIEADCNGTIGGAAVLDMCGTCDDDPANDCLQDCGGTWGGTALVDQCGTCDDDPANDCLQDCGGTWGGTASVDQCGTCDDDPANDCVQDCDGTWGGTASVDQCGTCDDDPANDCLQDCGGTWGGNAVVDQCGTCDDDPVNDCVQDCDGTWGGSAAVDTCGSCSGGNTGVLIDACADSKQGCACSFPGPAPWGAFAPALFLLLMRRRSWDRD